MASLKNTLAISTLVFLTACAVKFDPVEYGRMVDINYTVQRAIQNDVCKDPKQAQYTAELIDDDATWLMIYTRHIPGNTNTANMATELKNTTSEFAKRYQTATTSPSKIYCDLKLKNLATQIEIIQQTNARRAR